MDSDASHHITSDLANLSLHAPYDGPDGVAVDDGNKLNITHTRNLEFLNLLYLRFSHTLLVHVMSENLVSISQLFQQNNVVVEFIASNFQVKVCRTGILLLQGPRINGLYVWPVGVRASISPSAQPMVRQSPTLWHARLGHPSAKVLSHTLSCHFLSSNKKLVLVVSIVSALRVTNYLLLSLP